MRQRDRRHLEFLLQEPAPGSDPHLFAAAAIGPVLPPEFTWHDYTIFLLTIAAQIEHSLMVQYLYAGYSLGGPQVPEERRDDVAGWRETILGIAKEEMGHLATVQNALRFLDAPLALDREDYPWDSLLAPYPFVLEPLTRASLAKYVVAESPETWPDDVSAEERAEIERLATTSGAAPINQVGKLYHTLGQIIADPRRLPDAALHPASHPFQASWDEWGRGYGKGARGSSVAGTAKTPDVLVLRMATRAEASAALAAVAEQGEAAGTAAAQDLEASHFRRFLTVFRGFPKDGEWQPSLPLPQNPVTSGVEAGPGQRAIDGAEGRLWANIFNLRYRMLLSYLGHTFTTPRSGDERRGVIVNRMFGEMYNLRATASILVGLPLSGTGPERCGPPFQMPYSLQLPRSEVAYWVLHLDLIQACAGLLAAARDGGEHAAFAATLASLDAKAARQLALYADADTVWTGPHALQGAAR